MTISYQGAGEYNIYANDGRVIVMDEELITDLVCELFNDKSKFEIPYIDEIKDEEEELLEEMLALKAKVRHQEAEIFDLTEQIIDYEGDKDDVL